jgi:SAM-dependent methyltransferase
VGWQEDVHGPVAERLVTGDVGLVLDVGCGIGRFAAAVRGRLTWIGVDESPRQLADCPHRPVVRSNAARLPINDSSIGAVTTLWSAKRRSTLKTTSPLVLLSDREEVATYAVDTNPKSSFSFEGLPTLIESQVATECCLPS